jgi:hypothetical protein
MWIELSDEWEAMDWVASLHTGAAYAVAMLASIAELEHERALLALEDEEKNAGSSVHEPYGGSVSASMSRFSASAQAVPTTGAVAAAAALAGFYPRELVITREECRDILVAAEARLELEIARWTQGLDRSIAVERESQHEEGHIHDRAHRASGVSGFKKPAANHLAGLGHPSSSQWQQSPVDQDSAGAPASSFRDSNPFGNMDAAAMQMVADATFSMLQEPDSFVGQAPLSRSSTLRRSSSAKSVRGGDSSALASSRSIRRPSGGKLSRAQSGLSSEASDAGQGWPGGMDSISMSSIGDGKKRIPSSKGFRRTSITRYYAGARRPSGSSTVGAGTTVAEGGGAFAGSTAGGATSSMKRSLSKTSVGSRGNAKDHHLSRSSSIQHRDGKIRRKGSRSRMLADRHRELEEAEARYGSFAAAHRRKLDELVLEFYLVRLYLSAVEGSEPPSARHEAATRLSRKLLKCAAMRATRRDGYGFEMGRALVVLRTTPWEGRQLNVPAGWDEVSSGSDAEEEEDTAHEVYVL